MYIFTVDAWKSAVCGGLKLPTGLSHSTLPTSSANFLLQFPPFSSHFEMAEFEAVSPNNFVFNQSIFVTEILQFRWLIFRQTMPPGRKGSKKELITMMHAVVVLKPQFKSERKRKKTKFKREER